MATVGWKKAAAEPVETLEALLASAREGLVRVRPEDLGALQEAGETATSRARS